MDLNIEGLDEAELLRTLYNEAKPLGMGELQHDPAEMTRDEAQGLLEAHRKNGREDGLARFDYLKGRPLKVAIGKGVLARADLYDRDQGQGHAAQIVERLRAKKDPSTTT